MAPLPVDEAGRLTSIAVGNYANDHHYPGADWPPPKSCSWGGRRSGTPFCIPYAPPPAPISTISGCRQGHQHVPYSQWSDPFQPLIFNIGLLLALQRPIGCVGSTSVHLPIAALQEHLISDPVAPSGVVPSGIRPGTIRTGPDVSEPLCRIRRFCQAAAVGWWRNRAIAADGPLQLTSGSCTATPSRGSRSAGGGRLCV